MSEQIENAWAALEEAELHPSGGKARGMMFRALHDLIEYAERLEDEGYSVYRRNLQIEVNRVRAERAEAKIAAALAIPSSGIGPYSTEDEVAQGEGWNDALRDVRRILTGEKES